MESANARRLPLYGRLCFYVSYAATGIDRAWGLPRRELVFLRKVRHLQALCPNFRVLRDTDLGATNLEGGEVVSPSCPERESESAAECGAFRARSMANPESNLRSPVGPRAPRADLFVEAADPALGLHSFLERSRLEYPSLLALVAFSGYSRSAVGLGRGYRSSSGCGIGSSTAAGPASVRIQLDLGHVRTWRRSIGPLPALPTLGPDSTPPMFRRNYQLGSAPD
jgi:hypothetical protein